MGASPLSSECQLVVGFGLSLTNCPLEPRRLLELLSKLSKISSQALFLDKMVHLKHHLDTSACGCEAPRRLTILTCSMATGSAAEDVAWRQRDMMGMASSSPRSTWESPNI